MPDQSRGDEGLADIGAGRGDEDSGHRYAVVRPVTRQDAAAHDLGKPLDLGVGMLRA